MIKRQGGQCEANLIELASTPSWATTKRAGTRSFNGRIGLKTCSYSLRKKTDSFKQSPLSVSGKS